jgi:hypothetical protein
MGWWNKYSSGGGGRGVYIVPRQGRRAHCLLWVWFWHIALLTSGDVVSTGDSQLYRIPALVKVPIGAYNILINAETPVVALWLLAVVVWDHKWHNLPDPLAGR